MPNPEEERWIEERRKVIEEWSDANPHSNVPTTRIPNPMHGMLRAVDQTPTKKYSIELRFPDGPLTSQTTLPGSVHPARRGSAGTANGHYFQNQDPLIEEILNEDYSEEMKTVASTMTPVQPSSLDMLVSRCLCRPKPHMESHSLKRERNLLLALSTVSYCNASTSQWALLRSFYTSVAALVLDPPNLVSDCPRKGNHWQDVGFQGTDPATDFRGTGILGLIQLYCMAKDLPEGKLAEIVHMSRQEPHDFPLAVVGINITAILINSLRQGELLESAVTVGGYLKAMNKLYQSSLLVFCEQWREQNCTVKDCQSLLNRITSLLRNSQQTLLKSS
ncbi:Engulfment and cell motility domain containing protein [Trichostrongylus colubriformis]|uniref:Engulfment and cell motility domain containing protein n=1 Tax=Trichostrongylus colubriformis TaxID=6319 RepID=A0AAN8IQ16_TRICO